MRSDSGDVNGYINILDVAMPGQVIDWMRSDLVMEVLE